jgi:hypothetical protein
MKPITVSTDNFPVRTRLTAWNLTFSWDGRAYAVRLVPMQHERHPVRPHVVMAFDGSVPAPDEDGSFLVWSRGMLPAIPNLMIDGDIVEVDESVTQGLQSSMDAALEKITVSFDHLG